jgi:hypothetical protein
VLAASAIYAGAAVLSLLMAFDNFDAGIRVGDEVVFLVIGVLYVSALAASVLWRVGRLPDYGMAVAVIVPLIAVGAAHVLLDRAGRGALAGQAVPASVSLLRDLAPLVVSLAPLVAVALVGRRNRRDLFVFATSVAAVGWLAVVFEIAIRYR